MPATLNTLNSDLEDKDSISEKDEEIHVDPQEAQSSPHTLHAEEARRRNGDSTEPQEEKAGAASQNQKAQGSHIRLKVTIVDPAGPELWWASRVLVDRICQSINPEARFENVVETMKLEVSNRLKRKFLDIKEVIVEETDEDSEETDSDSEGADENSEGSGSDSEGTDSEGVDDNYEEDEKGSPQKESREDQGKTEKGSSERDGTKSPDCTTHTKAQPVGTVTITGTNNKSTDTSEVQNQVPNNPEQLKPKREFQEGGIWDLKQKTEDIVEPPSSLCRGTSVSSFWRDSSTPTTCRGRTLDIVTPPSSFCRDSPGLKQETEEKTITTAGPAEGSRKQRRILGWMMGFLMITIAVGGLTLTAKEAGKIRLPYRM